MPFRFPAVPVELTGNNDHAAPSLIRIKAPSVAVMRGDDSSLEPLGAGSMSREGNCWDNAVDESFPAV